MANDGCDDAYGVVAAEFAPALVAPWGRLQGRHRFRLQSAVQGRKYALGDLDPPTARETVEDLSGECEGFVVGDSFKEISLTTLRNTSWTVRAMGRFFYHEAIHLLETSDLIWRATRCKKVVLQKVRDFAGQCGVNIGTEPSPSEELSAVSPGPSILHNRIGLPL